MIDELNEQFKNATPDKKEEIRRQIHEELQTRAEVTVDLDNLPKQAHRWVNRGLVISCEGAGHQNHRHFKMS